MAKLGRPYKFTPKEFELAWKQYFHWVDNNPWYKNKAVTTGKEAGTIIKIPANRPYTEIGFCAFQGLGEKYVSKLAARLEGKEDEISVELRHILSWARARCYCQKFEGAVVGAFNVSIIARELGLMDKKENNHTTSNTKTHRLSINEAKQKLAELMSEM